MWCDLTGAEKRLRRAAAAEDATVGWRRRADGESTERRGAECEDERGRRGLESAAVITGQLWTAPDLYTDAGAALHAGCWWTHGLDGWSGSDRQGGVQSTSTDCWRCRAAAQHVQGMGGLCRVVVCVRWKVKVFTGLLGNPSQSYGVSSTIWYHTVLPATRPSFKKVKTHLYSAVCREGSEAPNRRD